MRNFLKVVVICFLSASLFATVVAQERDYSNLSMSELEDLHLNGDIHATFTLGFNHFFYDDTSMKQGVTDVVFGLSLLEEAHEKGHGEANSLLNAIYLHGLFGLEEDIEKANRYSLKAAKRGSVVAKVNYGLQNIDSPNLSNAQRALDYLIEAKDHDKFGGEVSRELTLLHYFGNDHLKTDYVKARGFAEICVLFDESEGDCEFILARDYQNGWGGGVDEKRSAELFLQGAQSENSAAMWYTAMNILNGHHSEPKLEAAFEWVKKSAELDYENAMISLGVMYALGQGTDIDYEKSYAIYEKAANLGSAHALRAMAGMYCKAEGREEDLDICRSGLLLAAKFGDDQAPLLLKNLFKIEPNELTANLNDQNDGDTYWIQKFPWLSENN